MWQNADKIFLYSFHNVVCTFIFFSYCNFFLTYNAYGTFKRFAQHTLSSQNIPWRNSDGNYKIEPAGHKQSNSFYMIVRIFKLTISNKVKEDNLF